MVGTIRRLLTRLYLRTRGGATEIGEYSANGHSETVFWYDEDHAHWGQATPLNTILMNEKSRRRLSDDALDYVFLHEVGHTSLGAPYLVALFALMLPAGMLFVAGAVSLPFLAVDLFTSSVGTLNSGAWLAVYAMFVLGPFMALSWFEEGRAELYAISELGRDRYEKAKADLARERSSSIALTLRRIVMYPPDSVVDAIARWRGIGEE